MAVDLRSQLSALSVDELRTLAASSHVDTEGCTTKEEFVDALARAKVSPRPPSLEVLLVGMKAKDLRDLASRHGVDVSKLRKKKDIAASLVMSPAAQAIYDEVGPRLEALAPLAAERPKPPSLDDPDADIHLYASKNADIDFGRAEDLLDQARMRFEERNFERAIAAAEEAGTLLRGNGEAFERSAWAYAILSSQRLIEDSGKAGGEVEAAAALLREAKRTFRAGTLGGTPDLLRRLQEVSRSLYTQEVQRARQEIYRVQDLIGQVANTGANVVLPDEALNRARDALRRNDPPLTAQLTAEAERLANESLRARIQEIEGAIPATAAMIVEAKNVGADVGEAEKLLEKAAVAAREREYVLAGELVKRAERAAMQSQHHQIEKAMELRRRQVESSEKVLADLEPIVREAESFDIDVAEARTLIRQARDILARGDYVNGTVFARNAAEVARRLEPKIDEERARRGIRKPEAGVCGSCGSTNVSFRDDGSAACGDCGRTFRWRTPRLWERLVGAVRD